MTDLDKLQALSDAATPGPWTHAASSEAGDCHYIHGPIYAGDMDLVVYAECEPSDAAFIAAARTEVPKLIAEVRNLRTYVKQMEDAYRQRTADAGIVPRRSEAEVKAEALRSYTRWVEDSYLPGHYVDRNVVIRDINEYADRIEKEVTK